MRKNRPKRPTELGRNDPGPNRPRPKRPRPKRPRAETTQGRNASGPKRPVTVVDTMNYKALVRPKLEYSSCIWDPSQTNQIKQIEKVQRRAARFTCNRYHNTSSVTDMIENLDWPTLQVRRLRTRLIMFYKIIHFQVAIYPSDLLFHSDFATKLVTSLKNYSYPERLKKLGLPTLEYRRERAHLIQVYKILNNIDLVDKEKLFTIAEYRQTRGQPFKLFKRRSRLNIRANTFGNRVVNSWNALPEKIVNAPSLNAFKSRLNKHWYGHPNKFEAKCYQVGSTGPNTRVESYQNAPEEV